MGKFLCSLRLAAGECLIFGAFDVIRKMRDFRPPTKPEPGFYFHYKKSGGNDRTGEGRYFAHVINGMKGFPGGRLLTASGRGPALAGLVGFGVLGPWLGEAFGGCMVMF